MLSAGICEEEEEYDDDEFNNEYHDDKDDFGLGYLFVISEFQLTRKAKWAHQRLNWLAHVKKLECENMYPVAIFSIFSLYAFLSFIVVVLFNISFSNLSYK